MLSHVMVGTNDLEKAKGFYGELLGVIGAKLVNEGERNAAFARSMEEPMIGVTTPFDGEPATVGNGTMIGIRCRSKEEVQALYDKAMALGAKSEGEVGPRGPQEQYYGGYFRDLDGNKLAAFTMNS